MSSKSKQKSYIHKLRNKYRFSILNDQTFEEVWRMRLSRLNVIAAVGGMGIIIVSVVTILIAFTPLREFIPNYPDENTRRGIVQNALKADSLERELRQWRLYLANIHTILRGENPNNMESVPDTALKYREINFRRSVEDSLLRIQIESEEIYNLSLYNSKKDDGGLAKMHLFPPVKGVITNQFKLQQGHFGVDIVAPPSELIVAIADGTVTFSSWTLETGYVLQIQHSNNLLSVYKHNSKLLKQSGTQVKAGEAIAIIGNSGELTTGPHLHFELWHNGKPINPEQYIIF